MGDLITIIVPVYNLSEYIYRCITSIIRQSYANLEIIIVNDGSWEDSSAKLLMMASHDSRIVVIDKKNGGVTDARLTGLRLATGNWIGFIDGDDIIESDMYSRLYSNAQKQNADISHCGYRVQKGEFVKYYYNTRRIIIQDRDSGLLDLIEGIFVEPSMCTKLFRRQLFESILTNETIDLSIRYLEDLLLNYYAFKYSRRSVFEDYCPYIYMKDRDDSASSMRCSADMLKNQLQVLRIIEADTYNQPELRAAATKRIVYMLAYQSMRCNSDSSRDVKRYGKTVQRELLRMLPAAIKNGYPVRLTLFASIAALSPRLCSGLHIMYRTFNSCRLKG